MREEKYLYGYAGTVKSEIEIFIRQGWLVDPASLRLVAEDNWIYSCALLYREKESNNG